MAGFGASARGMDMDDYRSFGGGAGADWDFPDLDEPCMDPPPVIGTDERRMHVRAYDRWVAMLGTRAYPAIADLDAAALGEFGPYSVLLDFSADPADPAITYLGRALREDGALGGEVETIADVPSDSLLSRLTNHYDEVLANRAPVGFEAEFVSGRGEQTLYRGILMPFSSDGEAIDFVHGVINWKLAVEQDLPADIVAAVTTAFAGPARPADDSVGFGPFDSTVFDLAGSWDIPDLDGLLATARIQAAVARDCEGRSRIALYEAISGAHEVAAAFDAAPDRLAAILAEAGITPQARAPMTALVKLVFGAGYDRKRVTEFAAVLTYARRLCIVPGMVGEWLAGMEGGIKAVVAAERRERRPALKIDRHELDRTRLRALPSATIVDLGEQPDEYVLLVGRREADGRFAILPPLADRAGLLARALRHTAM